MEDKTWELAEETHEGKYRQKGESFRDAMKRVSHHLKDNEEHYYKFKNILLDRRFLPAGRVQSASGAARTVTAFNCFVMNTIPDSMDGIMQTLAEAAQTMRMGGGVGYDFSTLRPRGALIKSLDSRSSGPMSFMDIFDAMCAAISSAGHRRGAQMACMRVDHPDIEEFITSKNNGHRFTNFNISVLVTDEFMEAVENNQTFDLRFEDRVYKTINARALWDKIMRSTWDYAEPGVIFIDRVNKKNNLWYCETISATNPCGEQPLPPYGACLLGSINLTRYCYRDLFGDFFFDFRQLEEDIPYIHRAMDNVIDRTVYPLPQQEIEAKNKRRMGIGVTGLANTLEAMSFPYGSDESIAYTVKLLTIIRNRMYEASIKLALEKGPFPLFDELMLESEFAKTLPGNIREGIRLYGIRNSHLLSMAPTGTISLTAGNVSGSIEPPFSYYYTRKVREFDTIKEVRISDYAFREWGIRGRTALELSPFDHVKMLNVASKYVDSACSKTCNVGDDVTFDEFEQVYMEAYRGGASGCTTFRASGKRAGILTASKDEDVAEEPLEEVSMDDYINEEGIACVWDLETGKRTCE